MHFSEQNSTFEKICSIPTDYDITFIKYKSRKTGLTVVLADIEAPLVNGFFTLATEACDDFGCPHTLEHLVFLGSEQFPYKGVLDTLANRAIAQGTNAWTDVDHTCYTITTAGSQGFLQLLPIYVDHILYPTLTDSGYYTEVHHINGKGEDAGVVYSEMQGCQNSGDDRIHLRMKRLMYPENCGYRSETGGLMERLRELSVDKIRSYHQSYYRPDNLCLVITGKVSEHKLLAALAPIEENIISKGTLPPMQRPWISTGNFPNLTDNITETVLFPDEDESMGTILIAWNGPMCNDYLQARALDVLNEYLTDSAVSVLQKEFVEIEEPLCTEVDFHITDHLKSTLMFTCTSVPIEEMEKVPSLFFATLQRLIDNNDIDMKRMEVVLEKEMLKLLDSAETEAHETAADLSISDFLYGAIDGSDLKKSVKIQQYLEQLTKFTKADWLNLMKRWYVDAPHITLFGKPSAQFAEDLAEEERQRVEKQRSDLGEQRLAELQKKLDDAKTANDMPLPNEVIENFEIPSVSTINFINVQTARNNDLGNFKNAVQERINRDDSADVPLFIQFDHIRSRFVNVSAHISAAGMPSHLLPYTRLFLKAIFSLPVQKGDTLLTYEDVVKGLSEDIIEYDATLGTSGGFREIVVFSLKAKASKYHRAVQWLEDILWHTQFTVERLKVLANLILNDIPQAKRDGHGMATASMRAFQFDASKSVSAARNILFQTDFLQEVLRQLENDPSSVLADLNAFRDALCRPENMRLHVSGDIMNLENPRTVFKNFSPATELTDLAPIVLSQEVLNPAGKTPGKVAAIVGLPSIENSYSLHTVKGPSRFDDPDIAPLLVLIELLDTMEGIFWKLIRGQGLAYSCFLNADIEAGLISYTIFKSPNAFKAFEQARLVITQLVNHEMQIEPSTVDGAKSAVIYSLVNRENTMERAALLSFVNQVLKQMPASYSRDIMSAIQNVTMDDLQRVLNKYLVHMFNPGTSNVVVVSAPAKIEEIQKGFEAVGFDMKSISLNDISPSFCV
ncbi:Metalloenzyme, LuxS/M16 peptidase-like protein [Radiomyces spectabilis]|uniref:Metalloenzyme, LuxS/M16 peptidase-like protein n=1 Tax=Radiomyces spectabilis TaxID=64574 RepID=UPI00221F6C45|nr:Metalloenzyme, LuxS/M16 peptidase-like protein [Radiomyces spectabilis]KAI8369556.1 Metalloenzyme, LuxS/M16 peptidase-like protein [Radiomyces spectabilis]